ncbi:aldehyde dehydrogenase family protein [Streptomyces canus]|uniref:aldehyde dehydrogenase family protein n=1 Tax=Streptomyces canus TaxID=58343 RepID=UPI0036772367
MLVHREVYDRVVTATGAAATALRVGDPFDQTTALGPVVGKAGHERILGMVERAAVPFETEDEAVELANSTPYGLGTALHTRDVSRVQRIVPQFQSGTVLVNGASGQPPGAPFGGYKQSGYGREGGKECLYEFLQTKNVFVRA